MEDAVLYSGAGLVVSKTYKGTRAFANVEIAPSKAGEIITLDGIFENVKIQKKASIKVQSGSVELLAEVPVVVEVARYASIAPRGDVSNIEKVGEGKVTDPNPENLSKECDLTAIDSTEPSSPSVNQNTKTIYNFPAGITLNELTKYFKVSKYASISLFDEGDKELDKNKPISRSMKIKVTAENKKDYKLYAINDFSRDPMFYGSNYSISIVEKAIDKDEQDSKFTGTVKFKRIKDETYVQGYYVSINAGRLEKYLGTDQEKYSLNYVALYERFIDIADLTESIVSFTFNNINLNEQEDILVQIVPIRKNKIPLFITGIDQVFDNASDKTPPATEGMEILNFKDTNNKRGIIEGKLQFRRAKNQKNIRYYTINFGGTHKALGHDVNFGYEVVPAQNLDIYNVELSAKYSEIEELKNIYLSITPVSFAGVRDYINSVKTPVLDIPNTEGIVLDKPVVLLVESNTIKVNNYISYLTPKLYVYNETKKDFILVIDENGKPIKYDAHTGYTDLKAGRYKVSQSYKDKESELSEEILITP